MRYKYSKKMLLVWRHITYIVIVLNAIIYGIMTFPNITVEERIILDYLDGAFLFYYPFCGKNHRL